LAPISEQASKAILIDEKMAKIQRYLPKGLTERILSQKDKIEGERKRVTVMFCDMEGFTSMVEKLGSEEAYSIMDQVYGILIEKVHAYGGTVNEMTGDGIMALFGAPNALEDAPQRALWTALVIHSEIDKLNEQEKGLKPIKMRIGIHTGSVVVGTLGNDLRVEFKAVGDTVNLASRMETLAEPGTTYVTGDSFKLTEHLFNFEPLGEREVKGRKEKVPVYKLLSAEEDVYRPRLGLERMIYSEMVGRDKEIDKLELQVMKARNGEGSVVNIIGEAGIGKSRLVAELKAREMMKRVTLIEGRAISIGRNLRFYPIIDLLKQWAQIREDDQGRAVLDKLETAVRSVTPKEMGEVLPFIATLMGIKLSGRYAERIEGIEGEALEKLITKNLRDLLTKATELTPLVIVIEDLHWADTSSIELMESLFRLVKTQKILFINIFRPGYSETGDYIIKIVKDKFPDNFVEIVLKPLSEKTSEQLINKILNIKGLQHAAIENIVKRADGNPFFIEEVVRSFIDEGALVSKDGSFEVTEKIDSIVIPNTISDVLMARIDRLEEQTRNLLKIASVIGRNFFYRVLSEAAKRIEDIDSRLSYLKEIQLIRERTRIKELEYLFKHALAQEATYESILPQKRKDLHLTVADSIEKVFKERLHEFYGMLALHYGKAEDRDKSEKYLVKAGDEALSVSASNEALYYYQEALNHYLKQNKGAADSEKLASFERGIALALYNKGQFSSAMDYFDSVFKRWGVRGPRNNVNVVISLIYKLIYTVLHLYFPPKRKQKIPSERENDIFNLGSKRVIALEYLDSLRCVWEILFLVKMALRFDLSKVVNGHEVFIGLAFIFLSTGLSFKISKKSLKYCKTFINTKNYGHLSLLYSVDNSHHLCEGSWDKVKDYDEKLIDQSCKHGFIQLATGIIWTTATTKIEQGRFNEVKVLINKLCQIWEDFENMSAKIAQDTAGAQLVLKSRHFVESLTKMDEAIDFAASNGFLTHQIFMLSLKARIQIFMKNVKGARETLLQADNLFKSQKYLLNWYVADYLMAQFEFNIQRLEQEILTNDRKAFLKYRKRAHKSGIAAKKIFMRKYAVGRVEYFKLTGHFYWIIGKQKNALEWWHKSIEEGKRIGARVDLSRTYMELGRRLLEPKSKHKEFNGLKAEDYLEKAKTMFQEMDLLWDMDELAKLN
jgi:class 3 adenylate cyclase/tetratricopeptide (TPR) repeat protein